MAPAPVSPGPAAGRGPGSPGPPGTPPEVLIRGSDGALPPNLTWTVGAVSARLSISASTLRTWERRYGIGPTERTAGGHRRYSGLDIARVELMNQLVGRGVAPRDAAAVAADFDGTQVPHRSDVSQVDGVLDDSDTFVDEALTAARRFDGERLARLFAATLRDHEVVAAWESFFAPVLLRLGEEWARGSISVAAEHLVSERILIELRAYVRDRPHLDHRHGTVLLASAEDDQHALPVLALQAALADRGIACHALGARLPSSALANVIATIHPSVVFLWASLPRPRSDQLWKVVTSAPVNTTVVIGGPGWPLDVSEEAGAHHPVRAADLSTTVDLVMANLAWPG